MILSYDAIKGYRCSDPTGGTQFGIGIGSLVLTLNAVLLSSYRGIDVHMECTILSLLKDGDFVVRAFGYDRERGRFRLFRARAFVLATGIGRAFKIASNSACFAHSAYIFITSKIGRAHV